MVVDEDLTWGGEHTIQHTDDALQNCTSETHSQEKIIGKYSFLRSALSIA